MRNATFRVWLCALFCTFWLYVLPMQVRGQAITEQFNFTGALNANGWTTHSGTSGQLTTTSGNLTYSGMPTSVGNKTSIVAGNGEDINKALTTPLTGIIYTSVIINLPNTTGLNLNSSTAGDYFYSFGATAGTSVTNLPGRLYIKQGTVANTFNLGILNTSVTPATPSFLSTNFAISTSYLVVIKYVLATNTVSLWVNPVINGSEPVASITNNTGTSAAPTNIQSICIRQSGTASAGTGNAEIDEIRVGSTWLDVVPFVAAGTLTTNLTSLNFGSLNAGTTSINQTYELSGTGLTANVTITAPTNFEVSLDGTTFSQSVVCPFADLNGANKVITVRFKATSGTNGVKSGNIIHSGFGTVIVAVTGTEKLNVENFDYGTSNISLIGTGGWNELNADATNPQPQYNSVGSLSFHPYPTSQGRASFGVIGSEAIKTFDSNGITGAGSNAYYSAFIRITEAKQNGDYFLAMSSGGGTFYAQLYARSSSTGYQLAISKRATTPLNAVYTNTQVLEYGKTYMVVVKYAFLGGTGTDDVCDLYVFPYNTVIPSAEPSSSFDTNTNTLADMTSASAVTIRQGNNTASNLDAPKGEVDYIRFGSTWADVTSVINPTAPTLNTSDVALADFGATNNGQTSTSQTYTLTATNLGSAVTVNATNNFEVSKDGTAGSFQASIQFLVAELATPKIVHVRFKPSTGMNGVKTGIITHTGFSGTVVEVRGTEAGNLPTLTANPTSLANFGSFNNGFASTPQTYELTATNVSSGFDVFAPTNFEISKDGNTYNNNITYTSIELATPQTVRVRFKPNSGINGAKMGNITHNGFPNTNVAVSGTETGNPETPALSAGVSSLTFGTVNNNAVSAEQNYTLTAGNLVAGSNVTVNAPNNFKVAKVGGTFETSITFTDTELANVQTVRVIFSPTSGTNGAKSGNITHSGFANTNVLVSGTEAGNSPTLVANPTTLTNFGSVNNGSTSSTQTYTLNASNLTADVTVTAPANFEVSKDGTTFASNFTYVSAELATQKTVTVRFKPTSGINEPKSGNITHSGFVNTNVAVSGTETGNSPTLVANSTTLTNFGSVNNGSTSSVQTYTLTGTNLVNDVTVTAPSNFQVSKDNTTFGATATYTVANFTTNATQTVYVRFAPTSGINEPKSGNITHSGFTNTNIAVSGTETGNSPTLVANPTTLTNFGSVNNGSTSSTQTYTLTASNLTADVTVTAPANFEVSKDGTTFASNFTYTSAELATQKTVTARFKPTSGTNGAKSGNITHSGFANTNVAVSGTEAGNLPTIQTSVPSITFSTPVGTNQASATQIYTLSVNNTALFTTGITVTAPTHFEVSKDGTTFSNSLVYTIADMATTQTVRVRFKPTGASDGTRTGNITHTSTGATTKNVGVTGTESLALAVETWANDFNISPNPTRGDLRFRCDAPARWIGADITFTDLAGKEVGKYVWANPSQTLQLHVRNWQKGTYLVRITAGKQSVVRKIVIL